MNDNRMRILLAEDESICQMAINTFAKKLGLHLDIANNGLEAVEKAKQNEYNLILMDLFMPEMDGKQATQEIRNLSNGGLWNIVALSGGIFID
jgi:CheY-like chemotaxis protein